MFKIKVYAGMAIIVALGVLAMLHVYRTLDNVAGYLATLDHVSVPFSIAALEMEKNTGEYASDVLRYVGDPDPDVRAEAAHDIQDFNERHAVYMRLSTSAHERELGGKVGAEHRKLVAAGEALMDERERLDAVFEQTADLLERIDRVLDGPMQTAIPADQPQRSTVLTALQDVEAETAEVGFWLTLFKHRPTPLARQRLLEKVQEQHEATTTLRALPLAGEVRRLEEVLHGYHRQVAANVRLLLPGETSISTRAQQFSALASSIDDIFDNEIQAMLSSDLSEPHANADLAIRRVQTSLRYIIPGYLFVAALVALLFILAIMRPLKRLAAGTRALGAGQLDYRIDARGHDEFGTLARQFNHMAERLQESTVSRELLEASEQQLQRSVTELRQEIAERQQAERERERLQDQLRRSATMAAMGQLVAGVAHEVRNPLFGISSTLDAMDANAETGRMNPRYREVLRREVLRLNKLMADLLEFGRAPPAGCSVEPLGDALVEATRNGRAAAQAAGVSIVNQARDDAPVVMNRDRLVQMLTNLIENALQHAPPGSEVAITTRLSTHADGRHWLELCVLDRGPGFTAQDLPRLFEPFFTRRRKGTGLGLAIVRRIVDEHHGNIHAANRPGGGASMTVLLPVAQSAPPSPARGNTHV
ncbi:MAG: HAMP domain-containing protein [Pseudomonadales bacterium]|jgi:signal transduction histidine kinase|nr:HAMP domain-containing protein [Pseudomonadales bacterium]MCP5337428.1 HAMP domain-containing protein [Pseudomonadales bacterium]